jgi:hypothetical protein
MAKLRVEYQVTLTEFIDWPDDELCDLNVENLKCNLDIRRSTECVYDDITYVEDDNGEVELSSDQ